MSDKDDKEITMPDFESSARLNFPLLSNTDHFRISNYLQQAFDQGRSLGQREGRELAEKEWYKYQELELLEEETTRLQEDIKNAKPIDSEWTDKEERELWETASCIDYLKYEEE